MHVRRAVGWLAIPLVLGLLVGAAFVTWALTPLGPSDIALAALRSDDIVTVEERPEGLVFTPAHETARAGFILYPGGRVDFRSYAPLGRALAENGYTAIVVPARLNLMVLSPDRASAAIGAHPEVLVWGIGGHSLGGAMAARYAVQHPDTIDALVLLASYPPDDADLSASTMGVVSVTGSLDGVLSADRYALARTRLPGLTEYIRIEGGNHAQFGSYGPQAGDGMADITAEQQLLRTVESISLVMRPLRLKVR